MSQFIQEELLVGMTAFQRTSSLPAMLFAIGTDVTLRGVRALNAKFKYIPRLKGTQP